MATLKSVWISGVTGNLGWQLAKAFLKEGYQVHGFARNWKDQLEKPEDNFIFWPTDLSDALATKQQIEKILNNYSAPEVVALTAGGFQSDDLNSFDANNLHQMMARNADTAINILQPLFPHMLEQDFGRIFFIGAKAGLDIKQGKHAISYGLSKSILFNYSQLLNELAKGKNIVSTVVVPSTIDTPENRSAMPDADFSKWVSVSSIVNVILFHAQSNSRQLHSDIIKAYHLA